MGKCCLVSPTDHDMLVTCTSLLLQQFLISLPSPKYSSPTTPHIPHDIIKIPLCDSLKTEKGIVQQPAYAVEFIFSRMVLTKKKKKSFLLMKKELKLKQ